MIDVMIPDADSTFTEKIASEGSSQEFSADAIKLYRNMIGQVILRITKCGRAFDYSWRKPNFRE
jgi:hypothetical protein